MRHLLLQGVDNPLQNRGNGVAALQRSSLGRGTSQSAHCLRHDVIDLGRLNRVDGRDLLYGPPEVQESDGPGVRGA